MPWVEPKFETIIDETGAEVVQEIHNYLTYGNFIAAVINFLIMAVVVFFIVKGMNALTDIAKRKEREEAEAAAAAAAAAAAEAAANAPHVPTSEELLAEIRDLLKNK
jgi:large conductance mechanosensitive channel